MSTTPKDKTLTPVWNEAFAFAAPAGNTRVELVIEDQDLLSNDCLGKVVICAQDFR